MREGLEGIASDHGTALVKNEVERRSDWPELTTPAFQSYFSQEVIFMHLILKVVSFVGTIVIKLRWHKSRR